MELAEFMLVKVIILRSDSFRAFAQQSSIVINPPTTVKKLHTFAHETAHIGFHGLSRKQVPSHRMEFEATTFAEAYIRSQELPVDPEWNQKDRQYVAWKLKMSIASGARAVDRESWEFSYDHWDEDDLKYRDGFTGELVDVPRGSEFDETMINLEK